MDGGAERGEGDGSAHSPQTVITYDIYFRTKKYWLLCYGFLIFENTVWVYVFFLHVCTKVLK